MFKWNHQYRWCSSITAQYPSKEELTLFLLNRLIFWLFLLQIPSQHLSQLLHSMSKFHASSHQSSSNDQPTPLFSSISALQFSLLYKRIYSYTLHPIELEYGSFNIDRYILSSNVAPAPCSPNMWVLYKFHKSRLATFSDECNLTLKYILISISTSFNSIMILDRYLHPSKNVWIDRSIDKYEFDHSCRSKPTNLAVFS